MKINRVTINNFLGLRHLDIECGPLTLIAGPNASGKTTVTDAIRFALIGEPGRVKLKRDLASLLPPGAKDGKVRVDFDGRHVTRLVKSGNPDAGSGTWVPPHHLEHVLDAQRLAGLDETGRRRVLLGVTGTEVTTEAITREVEARGLSLLRFEIVRPLLRAGFDAASAEAAKNATEAKGAWRAVTGETYGSKKAETWAAEIPEVAPDEVEAAAYALSQARAYASDADQNLGRVRAQIEQTQKAAALRAEAARLPGLLGLLEIESAAVDALQTDIAKIESAAHPPQGLIMPCPSCGKRLAYSRGTLEVAAASHAIGAPEAAQRLQQLRTQLAQCKDKTRKLEAAVATARAAESASQSVSEVDPMMLEAWQDASAEATAHLRRAEAAHQTVLDRSRAAAAAREKTQQSAAHHAEVEAWLALADALSPDGIPAELLGRALGPVNARLAQSASATGWMRVEISRDMEITADGRPYRLCSESERWRIDAMLAEAVAHLSGLRLLVLDRLDVLDLPGRQAALRWLMGLSADLDTILVAGTMKAPPRLPEPCRVVWLGPQEQPA